MVMDGLRRPSKALNNGNCGVILAYATLGLGSELAALPSTRHQAPTLARLPTILCITCIINQTILIGLVLTPKCTIINM